MMYGKVFTIIFSIILYTGLGAFDAKVLHFQYHSSPIVICTPWSASSIFKDAEKRKQVMAGDKSLWIEFSPVALGEIADQMLKRFMADQAGGQEVARRRSSISEGELVDYDVMLMRVIDLLSLPLSPEIKTNFVMLQLSRQLESSCGMLLAHYLAKEFWQDVSKITPELEVELAGLRESCAASLAESVEILRRVCVNLDDFVALNPSSLPTLDVLASLAMMHETVEPRYFIVSPTTYKTLHAIVTALGEQCDFVQGISEEEVV